MQKFIEPTYSVSDIVHVVNDLAEDSLQPPVTRDDVIKSINRLAQFEEEMDHGMGDKTTSPTRRRGRKPGSKNKPKVPPSDDSDLFAEAPTNGAEAATDSDAE